MPNAPLSRTRPSSSHQPLANVKLEWGSLDERPSVCMATRRPKFIPDRTNQSRWQAWNGCVYTDIYEVGIRGGEWHYRAVTTDSQHDFAPTPLRTVAAILTVAAFEVRFPKEKYFAVWGRHIEEKGPKCCFMVPCLVRDAFCQSQPPMRVVSRRASF